MKRIEEVKYVAVWIILWLWMIWFSSYAAVTWGGTIWSLFVEITGNYYLDWDNIQNETVDSSEIENETIETWDIKNSTILWEDIMDWEISQAKLDVSLSNEIDQIWVNAVNINTNSGDIASIVIPTNVSELTNDAWYITSIPTFDEVLNEWNNTSKDVYIWTSSSNANDLYIADRIYDWDDSSYYLNPNYVSTFKYIYSDYLRINWKIYTEQVDSFNDYLKSKYNSSSNKTAAIQFTSEYSSHFSCTPGVDCNCARMTNSNTKSAKWITWVWWKASSWYRDNQNFTSLYTLIWAMARDQFETNDKKIKSISYWADTSYSWNYLYRNDLRDWCSWDTIPFSHFYIKIVFSDKTTLVNYN